MPDFIVIDARPTLLFHGEAENPEEAIAFAKSSNQHNPGLVIAVYQAEVVASLMPKEHAPIEAKKSPWTIMAPEPR